LRKGEGAFLACVHNFTPETISDYWIKLTHVKRVKEVFNTDDARFGGSNQLNPDVKIGLDENGIAAGFTIVLSPLATMIFEVEFV